MILINLFFFLISAFLLGWFLFKPFEQYFGLITKITGSFLLGIVILTYFIFFSAYFLGFSQLQIIIVVFFADLPLIFFSTLRKAKNKKQKKKTKNFLINLFNKKLFKRLQKRIVANLLPLVILFFLFLLFAKLWSKMLVLENGNLIAGWISIWGDWSAHLSYITSFAFGDNFPPQMPILAGYPFSYTFFNDFLSAVFIKLGLNIFKATLIPSFVLSVSFCLIFFDIVKNILKSKKQAIVALLIFLFNGGLGFYYFFQDVAQKGVLKTLTYLPREYTHLDKEFNIQFINHITSEFIPQRAFLLGLPLTLIAFFLLWQYSCTKDSKIIFFVGLIASGLPLIHLHSFFILAIITIFVFITTFDKKNLKPWLLAGVFVFILTLPQIIIFFPQAQRLNNFKFQPGWMAYKMEDNIFWFWLKNIGLSFFLIPIGFFLARKKLKIVSLPFFLIFILANLFLFQPFEYDNTKLLTYWFLEASLLISLTLSCFWNKNRKGQILAIVLFFFLILSGFLDIIRQSQYQHQKIKLLSLEKIAVAEWIKKNTLAKSIFLTADNHDHPVSVLSGRKILLGFKGWLWTYGIDYSQREKNINQLVSNPSLEKLKELNVDFVYFSDLEASSVLKTLKPWLDENLVKVYQRKDIIIYQYPL